MHTPHCVHDVFMMCPNYCMRGDPSLPGCRPPASTGDASSPESPSAACPRSPCAPCTTQTGDQTCREQSMRRDSTNHRMTALLLTQVRQDSAIAKTRHEKMTLYGCTYCMTVNVLRAQKDFIMILLKREDFSIKALKCCHTS